MHSVGSPRTSCVYTPRPNPSPSRHGCRGRRHDLCLSMVCQAIRYIDPPKISASWRKNSRSKANLARLDFLGCATAFRRSSTSQYLRSSNSSALTFLRLHGSHYMVYRQILLPCTGRYLRSPPPSRNTSSRSMASMVCLFPPTFSHPSSSETKVTNPILFSW